MLLGARKGRYPLRSFPFWGYWRAGENPPHPAAACPVKSKSKGCYKMNRKLDTLGRLVIPKELRQELGWKTGTELTMEVRNDARTITLKEAFPYCSICLQAVEDAVEIERARICADCLQKIKAAN